MTGEHEYSSPGDNGPCYRAIVHALACKTLGIRHLRTRPYRPRTNGKAERFIRTLTDGLGLRRRLPQQQRTQRRARRLARLVQPTKTTPLTRPQTTTQPPRRDERRTTLSGPTASAKGVEGNCLHPLGHGPGVLVDR